MSYWMERIREIETRRLLTPDEVLESVVKIVRKRLGDQKGVHLFLFGSRASTINTPRSDFDIGIELRNPETGLLQRVAPKTSFAIQEELEALPILQKIDLVDFATVSNDLTEVAMQKIQTLFRS
jgi:predicted nucleotidyltransferase